MGQTPEKRRANIRLGLLLAALALTFAAGYVVRYLTLHG